MRHVTIILSLALMCLAGCRSSRTHQAWSSADSWYRPPSNWTSFRQAQTLPDADIIEVSPDRLPSAEEQLREVACVEITPDLASELTGRTVTSRADSGLFLVRAVFLNRGTGKFMVTPVGTELLVEHASLGISAVPMKRQALVVRLSQKPEMVFVFCSIDE